MSLTCPIPDTHDRIDLLELAIGKIVEHSAGERAAIVTLGDHVDRGPVALRNSRERAFLFMSGITTSETDAFILIRVAASIFRRGRLQPQRI